MPKRKIKRSSTDEVSRLIKSRINSQGIRFSSVREMNQIALAVMADLLETGDEATIEYIKSFSFLYGPAKTVVLKGQDPWIVMENESLQESDIKVEQLGYSTSVPVSNTIEISESYESKVDVETALEW